MSETGEDIILELRELYVGYYRDLNILQNLNIKARENQITAILGANGVGKSTALKAVFGFLWPNEGKVLLERLCQGGGKCVSGWSTGSLGGQAWRRHCLGPGCLWPIGHLKKGN